MSKIILPFSILALAAFVLSNWQTQAQVDPYRSIELAAAQQTVTRTTTGVEPTRTLTRPSDALETCPVTSPVAIADGEIPRDSSSDPIHSAGWYRSTDGKILAPADTLHIGGNKFGWLRPAGAQMRVTGRRLDREAPPMGASIPCCYPGAFQGTGLYLPTGGCWELEARAVGSVLRFVVDVNGPSDAPVQQRICRDLADAVRSSDGIIVGKVQESKPDPRGYIWQSVSVAQVWKNPYGGEFTGIDFLQGTAEPLLKAGHVYLIFLQGDPFQTVCPNQTLAEVVGKQVIHLDDRGPAIWSGDALEEIQKEIKALLSLR